MPELLSVSAPPVVSSAAAFVKVSSLPSMESIRPMKLPLSGLALAAGVGTGLCWTASACSCPQPVNSARTSMTPPSSRGVLFTIGFMVPPYDI
ncbi:hypothetical protein PSTEL_16675 [Paenibacillus stellifer]|uniref:Uncharacterized protein n=1 Tax=Paenibacillus stellifer TaxID=169760 RepID=A0A089N6W5_9BACL|nr:hypothetical protein PSTEL_16675 [Paenibacillus stellifer]